MRQCVFLTLDDPSGFLMDDELAYAPLSELGWQVQLISWQKPLVAWGAFDAVVIRSTWDYTANPTRFLQVLSEIEKSGVPLFNDLAIVRWNLNKRYLRDLAERSVGIVPTVWRNALPTGELPQLFDELGADEIVVKPVVGANASGAFRLTRNGLTQHLSNEVEVYYANRELMAQPFLQEVITEGEYSMFYFNGEYSHAILKTPQLGDFRVQEEHGGDIRPVAADAQLHVAGDRVFDAIGDMPLYARMDFVRDRSGDGYQLMELELIEPSLYFRMDADSPRRFAHALHSRMQNRF